MRKTGQTVLLKGNFIDLSFYMCSLIFVNIKLDISNTYNHRVAYLYLNYYLVPSFEV